MRQPNKIDVSDELLVQRWRSGVKLIRPDELLESTQSTHQASPPSVRSLFDIPCNIYFLNTASAIQNISEKASHLCGFLGKKEALGKSARTVTKAESAEFSIRHNNEVMSRKCIITKDEHFLRIDEFDFRCTSIKFPILNAEDKVIGLFGCSIILDSPAQALNLLMQTGLLANPGLAETKRSAFSIYNPDSINFEIDEFINKLSAKSKQNFSKREIECLYHLMKGKSARETGIEINLSQRTVEFYLNSLKEKLCCRKKSEIFDKVFSILKV